VRTVKSLSFIVTLCLIVGLVMPVFAQDGGETVNCNGLSDADCQILIDATAASNTMTSFAIPSMSGDLNLTVGEESVVGRVRGSAALVLPETLMGMMTGLQEMQSTGMMTDMQPIIDFYSQFTGETLMQMLAELGLHVTLDELVVEVPGETPIAVSLEVIFKDMGLYVRVPSPVEREQWFGEDLELSESDLAEIDAMFEELVTQLESEEMQQMMAQMSEMEGVAQDFNNLVSSYVTTTRGDDADMMGQSMAVFTTEFDLQGLLADPELGTLIMDLLENPALAAMTEEMEGLEINETQIQFALMTVGLLLKDFSLSTTQYVGLDDSFVHRVEFDMALDVDLSLLGDPDVPGAVGDLHFEADISDINSTTMDDVELPTDFRSLDDTGDFLVGSPSMIKEQLALGETYSGSFAGDDTQHVFSLSLASGQTVDIEIESDDYPYVNVYGPDGFLIDEMDTYYEQALTLEAEEEGVYLIEVEAYWDMDYDLTVRAQ
jgi:hypothetical protein